ncbi:MAG: ABC transporter ATP-binding protein [Lachnospiraceae bacterium]|nr:ABC transporter ATP-binding protein [Ruminococcus sp.]MCM1276857.1 ABC transporter ATP-binding protein [Lachnospiraceae bacterium]
MNELKIENLSKRYGKKTALNSVSITLNDGIYGLLGPNGAGKSTLMNILTQNIPSDGGDVFWNGEKTSALGVKFRSIIGFMPQQQELYPTFTAERFVGYLAALKGISQKEIKSEVARVLSLVELSDCANKKLGGFSGGMKQRVLIAQALLGDPKLIILDEPTAGLDPKQRVIIRRLIGSLSEGRIIIVSTHIVSDIETIADKIVMIKSGEIIEIGSVPELCEKVEGAEKTLENLYMQCYGDE